MDGFDRTGQGEAPRTAEVVVIGGGVNGASVAFQLAKRGVRDVVLLERGQLGAGATGKSGALVRCHYANVPEAKLTLESLRLFRAWEEEVGAGSAGFFPVGFLQVVGPGDEENLRANVAAQQAIGVETSVVGPAEIAEIAPFMRTDDVAAAAWEPGSGYADPNGTLYGFAAAAQRLGVALRTETPALRIRTDGRGVAAVETPAGTIATRVAVLAAGSWANDLLGPLGIDWGLEPVRTQVVIFRRPPAMEGHRPHPAVIDAIHHSWLRPEGAAGTLIGAERSVGGIDLDRFDETVDARVVPVARSVLAARFPAFATATMRGGWAGTYMRSPDGHPIVDQVPAVPGLWAIAGDSGTSFKTAPAIGICVAEWIADGAPALIDPTPFRSTRFAEGAPWIDERSYGDDRLLTVSR